MILASYLALSLFVPVMTLALMVWFRERPSWMEFEHRFRSELLALLAFGLTILMGAGGVFNELTPWRAPGAIFPSLPYSVAFISFVIGSGWMNPNRKVIKRTYAALSFVWIIVFIGSYIGMIISPQWTGVADLQLRTMHDRQASLSTLKREVEREYERDKAWLQPKFLDQAVFQEEFTKLVKRVLKENYISPVHLAWSEEVFQQRLELPEMTAVKEWHTWWTGLYRRSITDSWRLSIPDKVAPFLEAVQLLDWKRIGKPFEVSP